MKKVITKLILSVICILALFIITSCNKENDGTGTGLGGIIYDIPEGYVDLGLPSGTLWKASVETNQNPDNYYDFLFSYSEAMATYGDEMPTKEQIEELRAFCEEKWNETKQGRVIIGPSGDSIFLPFTIGDRSWGGIWSSTQYNSDSAYCYIFERWNGYGYGTAPKIGNLSVLLVRKGTDNNRLGGNTHEGYVDLGLPSGTKWKSTNEEGFYDFDSAEETFGNKLPTKYQLRELFTYCMAVTWNEVKKGVTFVGPNGDSLFIPATGYRDCDGNMNAVGDEFRVWLSSACGPDSAFFYECSAMRLYHWDSLVRTGFFSHQERGLKCNSLSVRLVQEQWPRTSNRKKKWFDN